MRALLAYLVKIVAIEIARQRAGDGMGKTSKCVAMLAAMVVNTAGAAPVFYSFEEALASERAQRILDPSVKLVFGNQSAPELAEKSKPDTYSHSGISRAIFGGDPHELCMEAFADNLESMISDAKRREYDAVVNIRGRANGGLNFRHDGFECNAGMRSSEVQLLVELAVTRTAADRAREIESDPSRWPTPKRTSPPSKNTISLSLADLLSSPEARALLGTIKTHWGNHGAPAYVERSGPDDYREEASVKELGRDTACRQAALKVLESIIAEAREQHFDGIIKIRSYLDEQPSLKDAEYECEADNKWASVKFLATLVKLK